LDTRIQQLEWVNPPRQARSAQTLERIIGAAEQLIAERGAEKTTVAEVARRAESSVGAFYARFPDKEALVRCVAEQFYHQAVDTVESVLEPSRWDDYAVRELVESAVAFLVRIFYEKRRLIRAATIRAANDEGLGALGERLGDVVAEHMIALLRHRGEVVKHAEPEQAIRFAVWLVMSAFHARCLYPEQTATPVPEAQLSREVAEMCLKYLGLK
jgi:AcrR family transcriptional regulator